MGTKICVGDYVGVSYYRAKFYPNWFKDFVSACVISRPLGQSDSGNFLGEGFLRKATAETRAPILTQNALNDAVPRKKVYSGGRETII